MKLTKDIQSNHWELTLYAKKKTATTRKSFRIIDPMKQLLYVRSLGELWRLEALDEPRYRKDVAFM